jgi:hypothetical protein
LSHALSPAAKPGLVRIRRLQWETLLKAYVPPGREKKARFVIDLTTSKVVPEAAFGKQ